MDKRPSLLDAPSQRQPRAGYAYHPERKQFRSTAIVKTLREQADFLGYARILGAVDHDLYVPELNFVFGEASLRAAVLALPRLRETFYGRPGNIGLFRKRVLTEAVHERGHTYGLSHCRKPSWMMFFSNNRCECGQQGIFDPRGNRREGRRVVVARLPV